MACSTTSLAFASSLALFTATAACGGRVIGDSGAGGSGGSSGSTPPNGQDQASPPSGPSLSSDGYQFIPSIAQPASCDVVAGMNAADLWCVAEGMPRAWHWDGSSWTEVVVPLPTASGTSARRGIAPAGPGALWLATTYGVARLRATGSSQDLTATVPMAWPAGGWGVFLSASEGRAFMSAQWGRGSEVFSASDAGFADLPPAPDPVATGLYAGRSGVVWQHNEMSGVFRFDGFAWTRALVQPGGFNIDLVTIVGDDFWALEDGMGREGKYCPDWCHPNDPPYHQAISQDWSLQRVAGASLGAATAPAVAIHIPVPDDVPRDGSVLYQGREILTSSRQRLALVGCMSGAPGSGAKDYVVIHEWDGSSIGPMRSLPDSIHCPSLLSVDDAPLADGTYVFRGDERIALVRP